MPDAARGRVGDDERESALVAPALEAGGDRVAAAPDGPAELTACVGWRASGGPRRAAGR